MTDMGYMPVPVDAARQISEFYDKHVVVIVASDSQHNLLHTTTYGVRPADKLQAARLGERLARAAGGDLSQCTTHEDFRAVDAATSRYQIETLTKALRTIESESECAESRLFACNALKEAFE